MIMKVINSIESVIYSVGQSPEIKIALSAIATYVLGLTSQEGIFALALLCTADFLSAIYVISKTDKVADSKKFAKKGIDFIVYIFLILCASLLVKTVGGAGTYIGTFFSYTDEVLTFFFASGELLSIFEHASEVGYKVPVKFLKDISKTRDNLSLIKK